ncbi:MAG: PaaI family thioesterase [Clostridiales Family XIII bacterium]|jgi:acyl-CoA thioesterase|nr:PaaI family thioesterase [Clostridiales Family XIII bacterium]
MNIEKIREHFVKDHYLTATGVQIDEVGEDYAVLSMDISEMHLNATGAVQGGAIFTLTDSAFAVVCNAGFVESGEWQHKATVAQSCNINFYRQPKGKRLIVRAECKQKGRVIGVYHHTVTDELGTQVALMVGNAYTVSF